MKPEETLAADYDFPKVARYILDERSRRKNDRADLERRWKEIDRQVAMKPAKETLKDAAWLPQLEIPYQAEALELLSADARRLMFPSGRSWFLAHAALGGEALRNLNFSGFIGNQSTPTQQAIYAEGPEAFADMLVRRRLDAIHGRYDLRLQWDMLNAEAFKYGAFVGIIGMVDETVAVRAKGGRYPRLIPLSIKTTYLDDSPPRVAGEGLSVQSSPIREYMMELDDLKTAAKSEGWLQGALASVIADRRGLIKLVQYDGDLFVPHSTSGEGVFIENVSITVVDQGKPMCVRWRDHKYGFVPYIYGTYHKDNVDTPYGVAPLIKGYPIQVAATAALKWTMAAAALATLPPVAYDAGDYKMEAMGGPKLEPAAKWASLSNVQVQTVANPVAMAQIYASLIDSYREVVGIMPTRVGAQTKSHQSAFAVDTEATRGVVRTVDYVMATLEGAARDLLHMEYAMARTLKSDRVFIPEVNGFVEVAGDQLPERVEFEMTGAGTPQEDRAAELKKIQAVQLLIQIEPERRQLGGKPIDMDAIAEFLLREGGFPNDRRFFQATGAGQGGFSPTAGVPGLGTVLQPNLGAGMGA